MEKSFVYGVAVTDYNFTGREEETRRLRLNFENGINSILISPRRWGKTSLVDHVSRQMVGDASALYHRPSLRPMVQTALPVNSLLVR